MSAVREICHLWRRAAFGPTPEDIRRSLAQGYEATVRELVEYDAVPDLELEPPFTTTLPPGFQLTLLQIATVIRWWLRRMVASRRPLQEKLTLFWHGHFTTSVDPVVFPALLLSQNQMLRELGGGRFHDLLSAVSRDPAMLVYLDGRANTREHPNENFAREVLELYTLGEGHYTEHDVRAAARAFTGWTVHLPTLAFQFDAERHDDGPKRFLGQIGTFDGDDIVRILAAHPQTARHISARLFRFFVDRDPSEAEVADAAAVFTRHRGVIRPLVAHILLSDAFRGAARQRQTCKSPVEFVVSALRALHGDADDFDLLRDMHRMGQLPFLPPSVKGWPDGAAWINTSTLLDRLQFAHHIAAGLGTSSPVAFRRMLSSASGGAAASRLLQSLGIVDASPSTRRVLATAWDAASHDRTARLVEIALASPEFQLR